MTILKIQHGRMIRRALGLCALAAVLIGGVVALRETADQRLLRRWLSAQASGSIPGGLFQEVETAPLSFRELAAREIGRPEGTATRWWRQIRPRLPAALRVRAPLPFTEGRRGLALLNLIRGHETEPAVAAALVTVVTNQAAANRRIALLALGNLMVVPPALAESLTVISDDTDYLLRLEVAGTLQQAWPRTRPVELALRRLALDPVPAVRQAAVGDDAEEPETATP
jgi:hypothetical protein